VILLYDILLTSAQEYRCIWRRRYSWVTFLYWIIRYCTFLSLVLQCTLGMLDVISEARLVVNEYNPLITLFLVFQCLRIWALYRGEWFPVTSVFLISIVVPAFNFVIVVGARACGTAADLLVLSLTWTKVADLYKFRRRQGTPYRKSLPLLLVHNGMSISCQRNNWRG
ncbi:hypothetical protein K474DRAFT_1600273, partial [Panus rudis PR-1116 ss-1]